MSLMGRFAMSLLKGLLYVTLKEGLKMTGFFTKKSSNLKRLVRSQNSVFTPAELVGDDLFVLLQGDGFVLFSF